MIVTLEPLVPDFLDYSFAHLITGEHAIIYFVIAIFVVVIIIAVVRACGLAVKCQWKLKSFTSLAVPSGSWRSRNS